jgi:ATP-dependent DNA helicase PIF1
VLKMALSNEQTYSFEQFKSGKSLFITGPGGTGKTKLIHHLVDYAKSNSKYYQVCAMTGCAAILLNCGARTIHSWSGIKMGKGPIDKIVASILRNKNLVSNWRKVQILIVDEVSMMSEKIFNLLNEIGKQTRKSILPFGGIQLIFTGDFYQLPPVPTAGEPETERFCFESNLWFSIFPIDNHIQLTTMFRQTDPLYIDILLQIRNGELTEENKKILQKYVKREYNAAEHNDCVLTKLFPVRNKADFVNNAQFSKIQEKEYSFKCHIKTDCSTYIENNKPISLDLLSKSRTLSQNEIQYEIDSLINNTPCSQILALKKGAAVMCTVNIDMESGICNGSQGVVMNIVENPNGDFTPVVKFSNGVVKTIQKHYWQSDEYPTIAVGQYPLVLAWALTIHKIQGATMSMAEIDIGFSIFEYGQTYVALSRIQSLDGLYLSAFNPDRIRTNPKVIEFYKNIPKIENLECSQKGPLDFAKGPIDFAKGSLDFDKYVYKEPEVPDVPKDIKVIRL